MEPETALIQQIVFRHLSKQDIFRIAGCCKIPYLVNEQEKLLHRGSPGVNVCCPNLPHTDPCPWLTFSFPAARAILSKPVWIMSGRTASCARFRTSPFLSSRQENKCGIQRRISSDGSFLASGSFCASQPSNWNRKWERSEVAKVSTALGDVVVTLKSVTSEHVTGKVHEHFLWDCSQVNATEHL